MLLVTFMLILMFVSIRCFHGLARVDGYVCVMRMRVLVFMSRLF